MRRFFHHDRRAFTLVEVLVSIVALTAFILIVTQLVKSASTITTIGNKHMDADSQGRSVLDRMAVDIAQMVKRSDVDYYLKSNDPNKPAANRNPQPGNDQTAFYSAVPGYYPGSPSPISLVAYRVNAKNQLERMGKGLVWNGSSGSTPMVFSPIPIASPSSLPTPAAPPTPTPAWPQAGNLSSDPDYEVIGPYVFRFEYYYLLKSRTVGSTTYPPNPLNYTPWDTTITGHSTVNAFQDVSAIGVTIAVIDPQSRALVSEPQLATLAGQMLDFSLTMHPSSAAAPCGALGGATQPGDLDAQWQCAANATTAIPRAAASAIHIYSRLFPIAR